MRNEIQDLFKWINKYSLINYSRIVRKIIGTKIQSKTKQRMQAYALKFVQHAIQRLAIPAREPNPLLDDRVTNVRAASTKSLHIIALQKLTPWPVYLDTRENGVLSIKI